MRLGRARRRARALWAPDVAQRAAEGHRLGYAVPEIRPGAHVLRLFLRPADLAGVRVVLEDARQVPFGIGVVLLDPNERDVRRLAALALHEKVVEDLAARQHDAAHRLLVG